MDGITDEINFDDTSDVPSVPSLTFSSSNENQRPSNQGVSSATNPTSPHPDRREPLTPPDPPSSWDPSGHDGVSAEHDPVKVKAFDELLASLESDDEKELCTESQNPALGEATAIPSALLETSPNEGLDNAEVLLRRRRYGWNLMKEEHHSHLKAFLMFFVGPIQFVMLVGRDLFTPNSFSCQGLLPLT